jgi:hypothetical protein
MLKIGILWLSPFEKAKRGILAPPTFARLGTPFLELPTVWLLFIVLYISEEGKNRPPNKKGLSYDNR